MSEDFKIDEVEPIELNGVEEQEVYTQENVNTPAGFIEPFVKADKHFKVDSGFVRVKLDSPVKTAAGLVDEVSIRKPKFRDLRRIAQSNYKSDDDKTLALAMTCSGQNEEFFNNLDMDDWDRVWCATKYFLEVRPLAKDVFPRMNK